MARTLTVFAQGREISFATSFADEEATQLLLEYVKQGKLWSNFAKDLSKYADRGYSAKQMAWVHKLVVDQNPADIRVIVSNITKNIFANVIKKAAQDEQAEKNTKKYIQTLAATIISNVIGRQTHDLINQIPDLSHIVPLFETAGKKLQKPKVIFWVSTNRKIKIEKLEDGSLAVSDPDYGFSGYITSAGKFHLDSHSNISQIDVQGMKDIAADPIYFARKYGLGTGRCCFCNRPLCDEYSIGAGYGATCAAYRGLPYGKVCIPVKSALL